MESAARGPQAISFAVVALAASCFAMSLNANVFAALNPYLQDAYGFDDSQLGQLVAAAGLAGALGALLLGPLVDRLGRRPTLLGGTTVFVLASCGYLLADGFASLLATRLASGFVAGVVLTSASSAVADLVPYERRGMAMGIVTAAILLAVPVGMPVAILLAERGQLAGLAAWRGIFVVQLAAALVTLVGLARALPRGAAQAGAVPRAQWAVLRAPAVLPALLSVALYTGAFFATVQFLGKWLDARGLLARDDQGVMWIVLGVVSAAGSALLGGVADRIGKLRYVLFSTAFVAIGLALLARAETLAFVVWVGVPTGVLSASRSGAVLALVSDLVPAGSRGALMGLRAAAVNLGTGTIPALAGALIERHGFPLFVRVAALLVALAWLLVRLFVPERARA
ncbi:MAG: MFS transporter [Planctomycetes bacterium]|nr:MFS transporter [Planctomycetota bacterium]